jgi:hypothetical protein
MPNSIFSLESLVTKGFEKSFYFQESDRPGRGGVVKKKG